ncbi:MAG: cupredoxin domain-containing protein [Candidatus Buchananbacteria bacterium]|nr:cupredoxin domain-containing protein [Candidatus Buchananbacteria bacterium]
MSKNKILLMIIVIIIILAGAFYFYKRPYNGPIEGGSQAMSQNIINENNNTNNETPDTNLNSSQTAPAVKEFTVSGANYSFSLKEMKVKKGDKVKIVFINQEGFHDFLIDEFSVNTGQIKAGESKTVEFIADQAGTFEYYCSVGQHRANGMFGQLIVE